MSDRHHNNVSGPERRPQDSAMRRFLGGSLLGTIFRLAIVSLVVGVLLMWLDIQPFDIFRGLQRLFAHIWNLGFDTLRELGGYILVGAAIVVPVWLILRLFGMRRS